MQGEHFTGLMSPLHFEGNVEFYDYLSFVVTSLQGVFMMLSDVQFLGFMMLSAVFFMMLSDVLLYYQIRICCNVD